MHRGRDHDSSSDPNRLPPTDECPVFADLSPLKPEKEGYVKSFSGTNYPYPTQLLASDQHQETLSNVHVKEIRSCSPSGLSQECLANPVELGGNEIEYGGDKLQNAAGGYESSQDYNISSTSESNKDAVDANQNQHGIRRRLQFEAENDSGSIRRCNSYSFEKPTYDFGNSRLPASLFYCDTKQQGICREVGHGKPSPFNSHPHPEIVRSTLNDVNSSKSAPPISVSVGPNLKQASQYSHNYGLAASLSVAENNYVQMHGELPENQNVVAATSVSLPSTHTMKPSNDSPCLVQAEQSPASCEESMSSRLEETDQVSSIRNRKRGAITSESKSCNHCNCERSKCLKLYCECFASETYCVDSCGCANCFNKPEYEDTVEEARQQIVSRNPHAFAPKVVVTTSPIQDTSARRHKRGCNCKKSKCLKKYCECYQSGVGCSDGCRCDNCQNSFGTKTETIYWRVERCKDESREKLNTGSTNTDSVNGMRGGHLSSTRQGLDGTSNFTPLPFPCLETALSRNLWNYSQTQFGTDDSFHSQYPTNPFTQQQLYRNEVLSHDCEDASIQYTLPAPPVPVKAVKASSPNVSPPKFESQGLGSISLQSLRSGGKFSLLRAYTSCRNENESYDKCSSDDQ